MRQLPLFEPAPEPERGEPSSRPKPTAPERQAPAGPDAEVLAAAHEEAAAIAAHLPPDLRFGTSSWSFPGWAGLVYSGRRTPAALARDGLAEYARHPLLRTVGIDRSFYAPVPDEDLRRYAARLPAGFPACAKAPAIVMSAATPGTGRGRPSERNPGFLSAERLERDLLEPFARSFAGHCGPFILECPPVPRDLAMEPREVLDRLFRMLSRLPNAFTYAVELRDRRLLGDDYLAVVRATGAAHVYSYWSAMPRPLAQAAIVPVEAVPAVVIRLLLRPGTWYEDQRERFRPFDRIVDADEGMRDDVVALVRASARARRPVYVLVNNKAEGSAPLTIRALAERLARQTPNRSGSQARPSSPGGAM